MGRQAASGPSRQLLGSCWPRRWVAFLSLLAVAVCYLGLSKTRAKAASRVEQVNYEAAANDGLNVLEEAADEALGYKAHPLTLQTPRYNLLVLRSILQHSNTSWQTTKNEAQGYFVQSLIWMQMIDGLRPDNPGKYMSAECTFEEYEPVTARIHPFDLHPGDRSTGHGFVFYVDCQLPEPLQATPHEIGPIALAYVMDMGILTVSTLPEYEQPLLLRVGNMDVPIKLTPPMEEKSEFAVCLSPLTWTWEDIPLWQLLEWRMHYAKLGVERVNWYGRNASMKRFIDLYREQQGGKDTFMHVPSLIEYPGYKMKDWEIYADQDAWYMDCILRNAFSSDFILIIDTDEFIMPDFKLDKPFDQFKDFMRGLGKDKGTIEFDRIPMARPFERGEPDFYEELLQSQFDCYHRKDMKTTKTLYRAHSVLGVHQHLQRKMYPMPPDVAAETRPKPKPNERFGWHLQHSYKEDVWPKLFHYRWWGLESLDVCSQPSFLTGMPKYTRYLSALRQEVAKLADYMDKKFPLEIPAEDVNEML